MTDSMTRCHERCHDLLTGWDDVRAGRGTARGSVHGTDQDREDVVTDARAGADGPDPAESFGGRLRRLRLAAGLSQAALADGVVHASQVSLLESGRRAPTPSVLAGLAPRLGVPPSVLAGDDAPELDSAVVLAHVAVGLGRPADAVGLLEPWWSSLSAERLVADPGAHRAAEVLARALERDGRIDDATALLERICAAAEHAPGRLPYLPAVVALTRCYREVGDIGRAIEVGERALARVADQSLGDVEGYAALLSTVAGAYQERGDLLRAQLLLDDLAARAEVEGSPADRAAAYWNAAVVAVERGRSGEGLRLVDQAAVLLSDAADQRWRASIQVTRAWVLLAQEPPRAQEARAALRRAMPAVRQHCGAHGVASAQENLARCELLLGRPEVARRHAAAALGTLDESFRIERARSLAVLGAASVALGEDAAGVDSLEAAASLLEAAQAPRQAAAVWRQLGEVYRLLDDGARALDAADRALDATGVVREPLVPAVSGARRRAQRPDVRRVPRAAPSRGAGPGAGMR